MLKKNASAVKKKNQANTFPIGLLVGIASGAAVFALVLAIFSLVILKTNIPEQYFYFFILIAAALSSLVCGIAVCSRITRRRVIAGMIGVILLLILEFMLLLGFNYENFSNQIYLMIPSSVLFGFIGCVIGSNIRNK